VIEASVMSKRFMSEGRGLVPIIFALMALPLFMLIGATIDYSRASLARTDLQSALDGAALAVGRTALDQRRRDLSQLARQAFDAGFRPPEGTKVTKFKVQVTKEKLTVQADANVPMALPASSG